MKNLQFADINQQNASPRFYEEIQESFSVREILPDAVLAFSIRFLEEFNLARTNFLAFSEKLENFILNFIYFFLFPLFQ